MPHLRFPSIAPGVQAFIWGLVFGVYTWLFASGAGVDTAVAGIVGAVVLAAVFLLVRLYGEDVTRRPPRRASR